MRIDRALGYRYRGVWGVLLKGVVWARGVDLLGTSPDVCVKMRELRDPQNGCQIGQVPLYGYGFCKTSLIRVQLGLKQLGVVFNSYSNPLRLRLRGQ